MENSPSASSIATVFFLEPCSTGMLVRVNKNVPLNSSELTFIPAIKAGLKITSLDCMSLAHSFSLIYVSLIDMSA